MRNILNKNWRRRVHLRFNQVSKFLIVLAYVGIFGCSFDPTSPHSQEDLRLSFDTAEKLDLSHFVLFKFKEKVLSRDCTPQLLKEIEESPWYLNEGPGNSLRLARNPAGNWLKIKIKNDTEYLQEKAIVIPTINLPLVELCTQHLERGEIETGYSGYKTEKVFQVFLTDFPHFSVNIRPRETILLFLYINSFQDLNFPILLVSGSSYKTIVFFRFLLFFTLASFIFIFMGWAIFNYRKTKHLVYLAVGIHYFCYFLLEYFLYGKEAASLFGNQSVFIKYSFFVFFSLHHFAFFFYMKTWEIYRRMILERGHLFWFGFLSGFLYILVPMSEVIYENRIFILLFNFGFLIFYFYITHISLREKKEKKDSVYFFGWVVFLLAVFYKLLYHFDFYPFHSLTQYASTLSLPLITVMAFLVLEFLEREKKNIEKKSTLGNLDIAVVKREFEELIYQKKVYLKAEISEEEIASGLSIGLHQLSEFVNSNYGMSFPALLNKARIQHAKEMILDDRQLPINEIATLSGFGSRSAFYLEFKKQTGIGPMEFKKQK